MDKSCTTKDDDYPIICRVLTIPGGAGFCPSTESLIKIPQNQVSNHHFFLKKPYGFLLYLPSIQWPLSLKLFNFSPLQNPTAGVKCLPPKKTGENIRVIPQGFYYRGVGPTVTEKNRSRGGQLRNGHVRLMGSGCCAPSIPFFRGYFLHMEIYSIEANPGNWHFHGLIFVSRIDIWSILVRKSFPRKTTYIVPTFNLSERISTCTSTLIEQGVYFGSPSHSQSVLTMHGSFFSGFSVWNLVTGRQLRKWRKTLKHHPRYPFSTARGCGGWMKSRTLKLAFGIGGIWGRNPANQLIGIGYPIFP